jgi:SAM-dependent methyltransferase
MDKISNHDHAWRDNVGGLWNEIGQLQFDFMLLQGLKPEHRFLDVGCGCFRGGVHFIKYLDEGNYYGVDKNQDLLTNGIQMELSVAGLDQKRINVLCRDDFLFSEFNTQFDFAIAQSVFTHLNWNTIVRCLSEIKKVLAPTGNFFATFFEDQDGSHIITPILHARGDVLTYSYKDPFHYTFEVFKEIAKRLKLQVKYIGEWNHPRDQRMMVFTHE